MRNANPAALVPPGSLLLREFGNAAWLGALDAGNYSHPWTHPDARMDALWARVSECTAAAARTGRMGAQPLLRLSDWHTPLPAALRQPPGRACGGRRPALRKAGSAEQSRFSLPVWPAFITTIQVSHGLQVTQPGTRRIANV